MLYRARSILLAIVVVFPCGYGLYPVQINLPKPAYHSESDWREDPDVKNAGYIPYVAPNAPVYVWTRTRQGYTVRRVH